ncbi:MAG: hypothetical protein HY962_04860 [Ignavibacteriae bacterium]|nr:hypothetical protein [Ignavibacteriota bacterium]
MKRVLLPRIPQGTKAVIFDTNVFLAYVLGNSLGTHLQRCPQTKNFDITHVAMLATIARACDGRMATTPFILTETSYFLEKLAKNFSDALHLLQGVVVAAGLAERYVESAKLMVRGQYIELGLADMSLLEASTQGYYVVTTDFRLIGKIEKANGSGLNFTNWMYDVS